MKRTIEIIVSPAGEIHIEAVGFIGTSCKEATQALEEALGTVERSQTKPEYHQKNRRTNQQKLCA
ncbi:MAG: DUF2997 domain-containing protein [Verrucomicrobia bacterium]|nr:DUF2997 domain-containing protein [Verrucomicrobiota bacterium]